MRRLFRSEGKFTLVYIEANSSRNIINLALSLLQSVISPLEFILTVKYKFLLKIFKIRFKYVFLQIRSRINLLLS